MGAILRMPKKLWMVRNSSAQPLPDAGNYHFPTGGGQFAGFSRSFLFQHSSEQKSQGSKQAHQPCQVVLYGIPWISSPHSEQKKRKRSSGMSSERVNKPEDVLVSGITGSPFIHCTLSAAWINFARSSYSWGVSKGTFSCGCKGPLGDGSPK